MRLKLSLDSRIRVILEVVPVITAALLVLPRAVEGQSARQFSPEDLDQIPMASPADGGPRAWEVAVEGELNLRATASTSAEILASLLPGTILDNLGCREAGGRTWCDVQELGGGPRGFVAASFLRPAVSPDGSAWTGPDRSALRAGVGDFDARGVISCGTATSPLTEECRYGVSRAGGGFATVWIGRLDGGERAVFYRMGRPVGADLAETDGAGEFDPRRRTDVWLVWIGDLVYEIPDAVVLGG